MVPALGLIVAYVCGSFPSAYLAGRMFKGIDLRTVGSGNLGTTNVLRNVGVPAAILVLLLDALKGALPVYFLPRLLHAGLPGSDSAVWWALAYGMAAIAGHAKPVFLLWKGGGKGVATASGVFAALVPGPIAAVTVIFLLIAATTGYVSLGSMVSAVALPAFVWLDRGATPVFWVSLTVGAFIFWTHRTNIQRLRDGTESSLRRKKPESAT
jgi:glycerol-3-phosphate acyltransferase PlsY